MTIDSKLLEVPRGGRPKKVWSESELLDMLEKRQIMSTREMAVVYGVSYQTMVKRLKMAREHFASQLPTTEIDFSRGL